MHMDRSGLPAAAHSTAAAALAATLLLAGPAAAGTFAEVTGFGSNPGALKMFTGMLGVGDQCDTPKMRIDVSEQL